MADSERNDGMGGRIRITGGRAGGNHDNLSVPSTSVPVSSSLSVPMPAEASSNHDNLSVPSTSVPVSSSLSVPMPAEASSNSNIQEKKYSFNRNEDKTLGQNERIGLRRRKNTVKGEVNQDNFVLPSTGARHVGATSSIISQENDDISPRRRTGGVGAGGNHDNLSVPSALVPMSSSLSVPVPAAASSSGSPLVDMCCPICLIRIKDIALGCGHMTCASCVSDLQRCPICRLEISLRLKLYL